MKYVILFPWLVEAFDKHNIHCHDGRNNFLAIKTDEYLVCSHNPVYCDRDKIVSAQQTQRFLNNVASCSDIT